MIAHLSVRQPCASWSLAHSDKKPGLLATSLVSRLEIFCLRLALLPPLMCGWSEPCTQPISAP